MGEVKQTNFRIDQETADAFRRFCEESGLSQAQGFDHIMQVVEMDRAKAAAPTRITEIEGFEKSVKDIMAAYLYSIEINQNAEARIREQFASDLDRKDKTIDDLRAKADRLQAEKDVAEAVAAEAVKAKDQAEKDAAAAEKVRIAAEKTAEDKKTIADTLAAKLAEAEKKAEGFDDLKAALSSSEDARKVTDQRIKDIQRDAEEAAREAARAAERDREAAVRAAVDPLKKQIDNMRDDLRKVTSEIEATKVKSEAEIRELKTTAELDKMKALGESEKEIARLRAKVEFLEAQIAETKTTRTKET